MTRNQRSEKAEEYRRWYKTARWQKLRAMQLNTEPLCRYCRETGRITAAIVCDHVEPHKGDETKFWSGPFQSLCKPCHDRHKQSEERTGKAKVAIGADGWPE